MNITGMTDHFPRLLADIGGTNARFAIETMPGGIEVMSIYPNRSFSGLEEALEKFLSQSEAVAAGSKHIRHAAMAIANPVTGDRIKMTNSAWAFSIEAVRKKFGFDTLLFINDFTALAMALPFMAPEALKQVGGDDPVADQPVGLLGAGTGLGVSGLIPCGEVWVPLEAEGGHATFSLFSEREIELLRLAKKQYPHVSAERFISGMGLELIYRLIMESRGRDADPLRAADITARALSGECRWCEEVVETFCQMLGTVAGNLALTLGARGGIYIGGGIVPRLGERFFASGFRQRFEEKGRFSSYLSHIPVYVIQDTFAALTGVSAMLSRRLG
ncbi:MAG: glucokinase [Oxalobacter sp.]|nr:glucokinase [Oxalobacter sp.]